jgi:predicted nucleic acid-binding protein
MGAPRIYLETTVFNRYFEGGREYSQETKRLFEKIHAGELYGYTSTYVVEELASAPEPKRSKMIGLISEYEINLLDPDLRVVELGRLYVEMGVVPAKVLLDAFHIAIASINDMDCIISLNFRHINKLRTKTATEMINRLQGYGSPMICTPGEAIYE